MGSAKSMIIQSPKGGVGCYGHVPAGTSAGGNLGGGGASGHHYEVRLGLQIIFMYNMSVLEAFWG